MVTFFNKNNAPDFCDMYFLREIFLLFVLYSGVLNLCTGFLAEDIKACASISVLLLELKYESVNPLKVLNIIISRFKWFLFLSTIGCVMQMSIIRPLQSVCRIDRFHLCFQHDKFLQSFRWQYKLQLRQKQLHWFLMAQFREREGTEDKIGQLLAILVFAN